jgi:predicted RNase H-like nuclease (RuvC/YqgF family)
MTKLFSQVHDAIFEHDEPEQPENPTPPDPVLPPTSRYEPPATPALPYDAANSAVYDHFCQITDPAKFDALARFQQMNNKLSRAIPDRLQRMKAAVDTTDVTVEILINNIQAMKQALKVDAEDSQQKIEAMATTAASEVAGLTNQLQKKREVLAKLDGTRSAISAALARRSSELDQMEKEFSSLR